MGAAKTMKVLVTGFEPFGGEIINPSWEAVRKLKSEVEGCAIIKAQIPVVFGKCSEKLAAVIELEKPDLVLCVGQAGGRSEISIERVAINISDAAIPDNEGNHPVDEPICEDGENAYFSNLPIKAMVESLRRNNIPASVSNTAGTYVCNYLMYVLLDQINEKYPGTRCGFIHVPYLPSQVTGKKRTLPSMSPETVVKALEVAIQTAAKTSTDAKIAGGTIC